MPGIATARHVARTAFATLLAAAMVAALCAASPAQQSSVAEKLSEEQKEACTADFKRLCPGTLPGGGRVKACFAEHYDELSEQCQMAVDANAAGGVGQ